MIRKDNIFSADDLEPWKTFLQRQLLIDSTLRGQHIRVDMYGEKPFKITRLCLALLTGVGRRVALSGSQYGVLLNKFKKHAVNLYSVAVRELTEDYAKAARTI